MRLESVPGENSADICVLISVHIYMPLCICPSMEVHLYLPVSIVLSISVYLYLSIYIYLSIFVCLSLSVTMHLSKSIQVYMPSFNCLWKICLSLFIYLFRISICQSTSVYSFLCICIMLCGICSSIFVVWIRMHRLCVIFWLTNNCPSYIPDNRYRVYFCLLQKSHIKETIFCKRDL